MISIVLVSLAFLVVLFMGVRAVGAERAKARDAQRVADMARLQVGFLLLFNRTSSYASAAENGCATVNVPVRTCNLKQDFANIATLQDPRGADYLVAKVPDATTYEISFTLERGASGFAAGKHVLTPAGVR
ncbi:MAG: hypothetical protein AAB445_02715 [Patescibacteria group bacterium]